MVPVSWEMMICPETRQLEFRKVSLLFLFSLSLWAFSFSSLLVVSVRLCFSSPPTSSAHPAFVSSSCPISFQFFECFVWLSPLFFLCALLSLVFLLCFFFLIIFLLPICILFDCVFSFQSVSGRQTTERIFSFFCRTTTAATRAEFTCYRQRKVGIAESTVDSCLLWRVKIFSIFHSFLVPLKGDKLTITVPPDCFSAVWYVKACLISYSLWNHCIVEEAESESKLSFFSVQIEEKKETLSNRKAKPGLSKKEKREERERERWKG